MTLKHIEERKAAAEDLKQTMAELFPLADEKDLPWAPCQLKEFLHNRIRQEVEERMRFFTISLVKVLCEVSPPKTHLVDMARIAVNRAKEAEKLEERLRKADQQIAALTEQLLRGDQQAADSPD